MFSVVVRGSWLIMEVVSGHVAYAALLCVLKPKKCTTSWKNGLLYGDIKHCNWDWRVEAKLLAIYHTLCEVLITSALDNKCTLVRTRTRLKVHDYLQSWTELMSREAGGTDRKLACNAFPLLVLHPIYFKTRPTALSWKIDYLKLKILQLPDKNHNLGSLKQSPGWGSLGRFAQHLIW